MVDHLAHKFFQLKSKSCHLYDRTAGPIRIMIVLNIEMQYCRNSSGKIRQKLSSEYRFSENTFANNSFAEFIFDERTLQK